MELSVGSVIAKLVENNIGALIAKAVEVTAEEIGADGLAAEVEKHGPGAMTVFITSSYPPDMILAVPDSTAAALGTAPAAAARISEKAADFIAEAPANSAPRAASHPGRSAADDSTEHFRPHEYVKRYGPSDIAELSWRASGCVSYRLALSATEGGACVYACIDSVAAAGAEEGFVSDEAYRDAVRSMLAPPKNAVPPAPRAESGTIRIDAPLEFLAGGLFIKPRIQCGRHLLESRFSSAALTSGGRYASAAGTWARLSCALGGRQWRVWYFFAAPEGGPPQNRETVKGLAGCIMREALKSAAAVLSARPENTEMTLDAKPDLSTQTGFLALSSRIAVGAAAFACDVLFEYSLLSPLLKTYLDPAEIAAAPRGPFAVLPLLFCLNQSLFRRRLSTFHEDFIDSGSENALSLATFLDLLPDRDCAVILQNYTLKTAGTRGLKRLFFYGETAETPDGRQVKRIYMPHAFNEARLLSFLPQSAREDWDVGKQDAAGSAEEHRRLNREMLAGIHRATAKKTLVLSPRTLTVLETMFMPGVRARAAEDLKSASAGGVPFTSMKKLSKAQIQQFLALQPNRLLCLALIGAEGELAFISGNVSGKKRSSLQEDLEFARSQYSRGLVETAEVLAAKQELELRVRALSESRAKEAAREKDRRKAGAAKPGGTPPARGRGSGAGRSFTS